MKSLIKLWPLLIVMAVLYGCKDYCEPFPVDGTGYMPVRLEGQTMRYLVNDKDTITFTVQKPIYSEKRIATFHEYGEECDICAFVILESENGSRLVYSKEYGIYYNKFNRLKMSKDWVFQMSFEFKNLYAYYFGTVTRSYDTAVVWLPQWTSPNGNTYTDVFLHKSAPLSNGTIYVSSEYGLLWFESKKENAKCMLLP